MPNRFSGKLLGNSGKALEGVKVALKSGTFSQDTITDKEGVFNINAPDSVNPKDTTITFTKDKFTLYKIKNPQPTGAYTPSQPQIDPLYGGLLNLKGGFDLGKYLISSLNPKIQEQLYWELFNVNEFVKENPGLYQITIVASESTIPNYDREEFLEDGVTPNPNWAGPSGTFDPKGKLNSKVLSEKRYNSLKTYIENFFKENGSPIPKIESRILVGGDKESDQYVRLEAQLTQVNCKTKSINEDGPMQGERTLIKPPGATKITLNAFTFPDRFGINGKYLNYYTQAPNTPGNITSWEFIVYLSLFGTSLLNDDTIVRKTFNTEELKKILLVDVESNKNIKNQLVEFINSKLPVKDPDLVGRSSSLIIDLALQYSVGAKNPIAYGFPIKRENTVISLTTIGVNESFILNQRKGVLKEPSVYSFKICDNR
jgi:hypothetical protein